MQAIAERKSTAERTMRYDAATRVLTVTEGKKTDRYRVEAVRDWDGRTVIGYRLHKQGGETRDVDIVEGTCDCPGHQRWGHCRHEAAVRKLLELGLIAR